VTQVAPNNQPKTPDPIKTARMELKRNYVPKNLVSIVGWQKPAVMRKNAAGEMREVEPAEFREGEMKPPEYAGTGFPNKIWAGTIIEVPEDEAREMRKLQIAEAYI